MIFEKKENPNANVREQTLSRRGRYTPKERKLIRDYVFQNPSLRPHEVAEWIEENLHFKISRSSIYRLCSSRYDLLDAPETVEVLKQRRRCGHYSDIEEILFEWQRTPKNLNLISEVIREKALEIWAVKYPGRTPPAFSPGWLSAYRKRRDQYFKLLDNVDGEKASEASENLKQESSIPSGRRMIYSKYVPKKATFTKQSPDAEVPTPKTEDCDSKAVCSRGNENDGKEQKPKIEFQTPSLNHDEKLSLVDPVAISNYLQRQWALAFDKLVDKKDQNALFLLGKISFTDITIEFQDVTSSASKLVNPDNDWISLSEVTEVE